MNWSFAEARQAARAVGAAELGKQATATIRPRGVSGVVRARAPLALLLYVADHDGLVVAQDGGFAVLRPPLIDGANRSGGYRQRMLRAIDRHWDVGVLFVPAAFCLGLSVVVALLFHSLLTAVVLVLLGVLWIAGLMFCGLFVQFGWLARLGAPSTAKHSRDAQSYPGYHWSVPLVHQPDPGRVDALVPALYLRLEDQLLARAADAVHGQARVTCRFTGILPVLTTGVTTQPTFDALADSVYASQAETGDGGVIVLAPATRVRASPKPITGGGFLILYLFAVALVVLVCAQFVTDAEAAACQTLTCEGRPATYGAAVRWLSYRLLFSDGGLTPSTLQATVLGLLTSIIAAVGVLVAAVALWQEYRRNGQQNQQQTERISVMTDRSRVLILVVNERERNAVLDAVRRRTNQRPALDQGLRTAFLLGSVGGADVLLAQAGEAGTATAAGMTVSAIRWIERLDPDYVVLTGIGYGLKPEDAQRKGHILVSSRVQGVDLKKVKETEVIYRGDKVSCSPVLLDRFTAAAVAWSGARVHFGTLLSSNTLVNSRRLVEELKEDFPEAIGGEMEASGLIAAAQDDFKPDWIVVKAISDWGYDKTDGWQKRAATNAAEFVMEVLASGGLARRRAERASGRT